MKNFKKKRHFEEICVSKETQQDQEGLGDSNNRGDAVVQERSSNKKEEPENYEGEEKGDKGEEEEEEEEEEALLAAAAQWANDAEQRANLEEKTKNDSKSENNNIDDGDDPWMSTKSTKTEIASQKRPSLSIHLTQVPFDSNQSSIRLALEQHSCSVQSVRMVYDYAHEDDRRHNRRHCRRQTQTNPKKSTMKRLFRGVAFVDLQDEASYHRALSLHRTAFLGGNGRLVNVRPTMSKTEIADIAHRTQEILASRRKLRKQKTETTSSNADQTNIVLDHSNQKNEHIHKNIHQEKNESKKAFLKTISSSRKRARDNTKIEDKQPKTKKNKNVNVDQVQSTESSKEKKLLEYGTCSKKKSHKQKSKDATKKMTKKERAKKAAIIRAKRRK